MSLKKASHFWFRLGLVSFGGPSGQIALLQRELVDRRYLHALNYCMLLHGPEATQLATYLGWLIHGVPGGLIAGGLFLLPSVLVLNTLVSIYVLWGQLLPLVSVFAVLKPAVLAIVLVAAWRVGQRAPRTPLLIAIAALAFLAFRVLRLPNPLVVPGAASAGFVAGRWRAGLLFAASHPEPVIRASSTPAGTSAPAEQDFIHGDRTPTPEHCRFSPLALLRAAWGWNGSLALMARFFTRVALLSFAGAYAVLPYAA